MNLLLTVIAIALLGMVAGLLLGGAARYGKERGDPVVTAIDTLLPQSQCAQCGYPGCLPYATAVAKGEAIDKCVPGGRGVVIAIANLLNQTPPTEVDAPVEALSASATPENKVAVIDESHCIGCTKCLQVCPVDAIIGTTKAMHTVLTAYCTGCTLCVAPCPTQCIQMVAIEQVAAQQLLEEIAASDP